MKIPSQQDHHQVVPRRLDHVISPRDTTWDSSRQNKNKNGFHFPEQIFRIITWRTVWIYFETESAADGRTGVSAIDTHLISLCLCSPIPIQMHLFRSRIPCWPNTENFSSVPCWVIVSQSVSQSTISTAIHPEIPSLCLRVFCLLWHFPSLINSPRWFCLCVCGIISNFSTFFHLQSIQSVSRSVLHESHPGWSSHHNQRTRSLIDPQWRACGSRLFILHTYRTISAAVYYSWVRWPWHTTAWWWWKRRRRRNIDHLNRI